MDFDLEAVLAETAQQVGNLAARCASLNGQLVALQKFSAKQAAEIAELRKPFIPVPTKEE